MSDSVVPEHNNKLLIRQPKIHPQDDDLSTDLGLPKKKKSEQLTTVKKKPRLRFGERLLRRVDITKTLLNESIDLRLWRSKHKGITVTCYPESILKHAHEVGKTAIFTPEKKVSPPSEEPMHEQKATSLYSSRSLKQQLSLDLRASLKALPENIILSPRKAEDRESTISPRHLRISAQGYPLVAKALSSHQGSDWDFIRNVDEVKIQEVLAHLQLIIEKKPPEISRDLIAFTKLSRCVASDTLKEGSLLTKLYETSELCPDDKVQLLGKMIYLLDRCPETLISLIQPIDSLASLEKIELHFSKRMKALCTSLADLHAAHTRIGLHDADLAVEDRIPVEIAKALISNIGWINSGLIEPMRQIFGSSGSLDGHSYVPALDHALMLLQETPSLRTALSKIEAPSHHQRGSMIVRTTLSLQASEPVDAVNTRKAVLSGLLAHLRQDPESGSCFAVRLAVSQLSSHVDQCIEDFVHIIHHGCLTREMDGVNVDIPFLEAAPARELNRQITIDQEGQLLVLGEDPIGLWEIPGLVAAAQAVHVTDVQKSFEEIAIQLFKNKASEADETVEVCIKEVLKHLCAASPASDHSEPKFSQASMAYYSQTVNTLQKAWEGTIAGLGHQHLSAGIKDGVFAALEEALSDPQWLGLNVSLEEQAHFSQAIRKELAARIQVLYDPSCQQKDLPGSSHDISGGFVLYDRGKNLPWSQWQRVGTPQAFSKFLERIFSSTADTHAGLSEHFVGHSNTPKFLENILNHYRLHYNLEASSIGNYRKLRYTPWLTRIGGDAVRTEELYHSEKGRMDLHDFTPKTPTETLGGLIHAMRQLPEEQQEALLGDTHSVLGARIRSLHAFSLLAGHPSFTSLWKGKGNISQQLDVHVLAPGREIAHTQMPTKTREALIEHCCSHVIASSKKEEFLKAVKNIPEDLSIAVFSHQLKKVISHINQTIPGVGVPNQALDRLLIENLPSKLHAKLCASRVIFADSNWSHGTQDIVFCFLVNPSTAKLELWESDQPGTYFNPVSRSWTRRQTWEIFSFNDVSSVQIPPVNPTKLLVTDK